MPMDFYEVRTKINRKEKCVDVYPEFLVMDSEDLMIRGDGFYAFWDEKKELWSMKQIDIQKKIDADIRAKLNELKQVEEKKSQNDDSYVKKEIRGLVVRDYSTGQWEKFNRYAKSLGDHYKQLDTDLTFSDTKITKDMYVSRKLSYTPVESSYDAWDKLISTLYDPEERQKIEWAIGSILAGESKKIQKFLVFYGPKGSGKSTILDIIMKLFDGYYTTFKAENLVKGNDAFNLDFLAENPLVAIDTDCKLDKIESNALLNKLVSHEQVKVNEKFKNRYPMIPTCMILMGTNNPVRITDAKSGIIRRLIDVEPSGRLIPEDEYWELMDHIQLELGGIAWHCLEVFKRLKKNYYSKYIPERMMFRTDPFYNFMLEKSDLFISKKFEKGVSGNEIWAMWKNYCNESGIDFTRKRFEIIDEAKNYFNDFKVSTKIDGVPVRSWFSGFKIEKFQENKEEPKAVKVAEPSAVMAEDPYSFGWLKLCEQPSLFDQEFADWPAQYEIAADGKTRPEYTWAKCKMKLRDIDTSKTHFVKGPGKLIFVDFDKHGADGKKDLQANMKALVESKLKHTYVETSNSGGGLHAYYWYDGNVDDLSSVLDLDIEVKVFPEDKNLSIRRRVFLCNDLPIAHISSGLPKKEKKVVNWEGVKDDKHLRNLVLQAIKKEVNPYGGAPKTVTCVKWISEILKNAQESGLAYDIRDLDAAIYAFAANSHNNKQECINMYYGMELVWPREVTEPVGNMFVKDASDDEKPVIILDCEVVRNVTLVVYKELEPDGVAGIYKEHGPDRKCVRLFNPTPHEIERLIDNTRIVGHNTTGYDNFILYALMLGYTPEQVFEVSQDIIVHGNRSPWREAKNIGYTDTYDVSSDKKGLKKIEIEMHLPHKEMEIDWSKPLPESEWERLAEYCENDVLATEAYFLSKEWQADFKARQILAALTGMTVNDSTNNLTAQLIFGDVKEPQGEFNYPDLRDEFEEYRFENGKSYFRTREAVALSEDFQAKLAAAQKEYGEGFVRWNEAERWIECDVLIGEGGRVYAEEGKYDGVITFDVSGMHPSTIIKKLGFGPYTKAYQDLYEARIAIKHKDYDAARKMFDGRLAPYLENDDDADNLSHALKIALNSVYGMTAAHFKNRFKDPRNVDNWVAKRGALFMERLRREVQKRGGHVIHIKTDSIKLVQPTKELQDFVWDFGKRYGYTFEIESKYERICLVNHAVYIAYREKDDPGWLKECAKTKKKAEKDGSAYIEPTRWTATGAQFAHPFVFKQMFSHEEKEFWDFCETKTVKTALYLDLNEQCKDVSLEEKEKKKIQTRIRKLQKDWGAASDIDKEKIEAEIADLQKDISVLDETIAEGHNYQFVGKAGEFMPIKDGLGGGLLMRKDDDGNYSYATGAKGYRWLESEAMHKRADWKDYIDIRYFRGLVDVARETIGEYCDVDMFVRVNDAAEEEHKPWTLPCGNEVYMFCSDCEHFSDEDGKPACKKGFNIQNQFLGESKESIL